MTFVPVAVGELVEQHASEAAFLWDQRDLGVRSPGYDLDDIADVDERLEAQLDGLRIAGAMGSKLAFAALLSAPEAGEAFVAAKLALDRGDMRGFARVLDLVEEQAELWRALVSAIGFCPYDSIEKVLRALVSQTVPTALRRMGIAGLAAHRQDPGRALERALGDSDRGLRLQAIKAAGVLGAKRLLPELVATLASEDAEERFWACYSAALLGDAGAIAKVQRFAEEGEGDLAERAVRLAAGLLEPEPARSWILALDERGRRRLALIGAETAGHPGLLAWLTACMRAEEHARRAGQAFFALTGEPIQRDLKASAPEATREPAEEPDDVDPSDDPDEDLAWPAPDAVDSWIARQGPQLPVGRLLLGRPITGDWLQTVLRDGPQTLRQLASWVRLRQGLDATLFPVQAPAWEQRARLPPRSAGVEPLSSP